MSIVKGMICIEIVKIQPREYKIDTLAIKIMDNKIKYFDKLAKNLNTYLSRYINPWINILEIRMTNWISGISRIKYWIIYDNNVK